MSDNSEWSQEELVQAITKLQLAPQNTDAPKELSRWLVWLPWLKKTGNTLAIFSLGAAREWANGKASQETAKTDALIEEAGELASRVDLNYAEAELRRAEADKTATERLREQNHMIDEALDGDGLAVELKLANILSHRPDIADQVEKVQEIAERLRLQRGASFEFQVNDAHREYVSPLGSLDAPEPIPVSVEPGTGHGVGSGHPPAVEPESAEGSGEWQVVEVGRATETDEARPISVNAQSSDEEQPGEGNLAGTINAKSKLRGKLTEEPAAANVEEAKGYASLDIELDTGAVGFKTGALQFNARATADPTSDADTEEPTHTLKAETGKCRISGGDANLDKLG